MRIREKLCRQAEKVTLWAQQGCWRSTAKYAWLIRCRVFCRHCASLPTQLFCRANSRQRTDTNQAANLASWLEWDRVNVSCCTLIRDEGDGNCDSFFPFLVYRATLLLLPKAAPHVANLDPLCGRKDCQFEARLLWHSELLAHDLRNDLFTAK